MAEYSYQRYIPLTFTPETLFLSPQGESNRMIKQNFFKYLYYGFSLCFKIFYKIFPTLNIKIFYKIFPTLNIKIFFIMQFKCELHENTYSLIKEQVQDRRSKDYNFPIYFNILQRFYVIRISINQQ